MREFVHRALPQGFKRILRTHAEKRRLNGTAPMSCEADVLRRVNRTEIAAALCSPEISAEWEETAQCLAALDIPDGTGGINPGDRRAVYHLLRGFGASAVLEIGTHIGASTVHIAAALRRACEQDGACVRLSTVDVKDVNDPDKKPWLRSGTLLSPAEMIERLGCRDFVRFHAQRSLDFMWTSEVKFDFIFLDGDHSADTVYSEIPAALAVLNEGGVILIHDYFPQLKPLRPDGYVAPGPCLATERLRAEGAELTVRPLGPLPWPTRPDSFATSLAVLSRT